MQAAVRRFQPATFIDYLKTSLTIDITQRKYSRKPRRILCLHFVTKCLSDRRGTFAFGLVMSGFNLEGAVRSSIIDLPRGLHLLKYKHSSAPLPPVVHFELLSGHAGQVSLLHHPDAAASSLDQPGDAVALTSTGGAKMRLIVEAREANGSFDAQIDLETLVGLLAERSGRIQPLRHGAKASLSVLGHVSRRGDIVAASGEWLAGPSAPTPIEGIAIRIEGAPASWIEGQVLVAGTRQWSAWQPAGTFLGTRGHARALVGLRFRLTAAAPSEAGLEGSALFLGSAVIRQDGRAIEFLSAAERDPLIGLRLVIQADPPPTIESRPPVNDLGSQVAQRGRVRVFRAGAEVSNASVRL